MRLWIGVMAVAVLTASACSGAQRAVRSMEPAPMYVESVVFLDQGPPDDIFLQQYYQPITERTRLADLAMAYEPPQSRTRRYFEKGVKKLAGVVDGMPNPTIDDIVTRYEERVDDAGDRYQSIERFMTRTLGIREDEFRTGVGVTAATAATTLTALHALNPVGLSNDLFGTKFRAGYDVSKLDNPKMLLSYNNQLGMTLSRKGIGGSVGTANGYVYSADLNIADKSAAANLSLNDSVALGTLYAHDEELVKGFVSLSF